MEHDTEFDHGAHGSTDADAAKLSLAGGFVGTVTGLKRGGLGGAVVGGLVGGTFGYVAGAAVSESHERIPLDDGPEPIQVDVDDETGDEIGDVDDTDGEETDADGTEDESDADDDTEGE